MVIKILNTACKLSSSPVTTVTTDGLKRRLEFEAGKKPKTTQMELLHSQQNAKTYCM